MNINQKIFLVNELSLLLFIASIAIIADWKSWIKYFLWIPIMLFAEIHYSVRYKENSVWLWVFRIKII